MQQGGALAVTSRAAAKGRRAEGQEGRRAGDVPGIDGLATIALRRW